MKITLFTSNQSRHNYLANQLSQISDELYIIQENKKIFPGLIPGNYPKSKIMEKYFTKVGIAQDKIFGKVNVEKKKNINLLSIPVGDLNKCSLDDLKKFLKSDIYVVFGSSFIKGDLVNFLIEKKTINIHMGISPYYRGTDCNFWALYDNNPHLVGSTIHLLSKGLDSGPILYHALSEIHEDPFLYSMSTVKSAFLSIIERLKNKSIFQFEKNVQEKIKEIRYSRKNEFVDNIVEEYFKKKLILNDNFNLELYKNPFILKKSKYLT